MEYKFGTVRIFQNLDYWDADGYEYKGEELQRTKSIRASVYHQDVNPLLSSLPTYTHTNNSIAARTISGSADRARWMYHLSAMHSKLRVEIRSKMDRLKSGQLLRHRDTRSKRRQRDTT